MKRIYKVKNMSCSACANKIEQELSKYNINAKVNVISEKMVVKDDYIDDLKIKSIVEKLGYNLENTKVEEIEDYKITPIAIFSILNIILAMFMVKNTQIIQLILCTLVIILTRKILIDGIKSLINLSFNMNSLITLGSSFSYLYSLYNLLNMNDNIYFEGVSSILFIVIIGKKIESKLKKSAKSAIDELTDMLPKINLKLNDILTLKEGQIVPADGKIVKGQAYFNESLLTGESSVRLKKENDIIYAGCLLEKGNVEYKVTALEDDMVISKIKNILELSFDIKSNIKSITDKVTKYFVPIVIIISFITFLIWYFVFSDVYKAINNAVCVLVIACPCSIGLAMPVSLEVATGILAKKHILIKDMTALLRGYKIDRVILDKTGTLTSTKSSVVDNTCDMETLQAVYNIEKYIDHPISNIITNYIKKNFKVNDTEFKNVRNFKGLGVGSQEYTIGNLQLMKRKKINLSDEDIFEYKRLSKQGKTVILIAKYEKIVGYLTIFSDILKESFDFISYCSKNNIKVSMLTGDNIDTSRYIADKLKIKDVMAEVLPYEKSKYVENMLNKDNTVCMIGDGINDAPSLITADVGIAIGSGADVAIKSCDVIITSLADVKHYISISELCMKNIKENLFFGFIYNILGIVIATGIIKIELTPMLASIFMMLSSISVLLNSLRLKRSAK